MTTDRIDRMLEEIAALKQALESANEKLALPASSVDKAQWLAGILAHSPDIISILDREGRLLYINRTAPTTSPREVVGRDAATFLPDEHRETWSRAVERAWTGGEPQQVEVFSHGSFWWSTRLAPIQQDGLIRCVLSIGTDITAQKRAESALVLKEEQLRLALEASGMGQWQWKVREDVASWDTASRRILGLSDARAETTYADFLELVHPSDRERIERQTSIAVETGEYPTHEHRVILPDGRERWVLVIAKAVLGADRRATHLLGGLLDVTQQRRSEAERERAQKLEALGQLAGGVAHDFNNLLVAIMGNIQIAGDKQRTDEAAPFLADALTSCSRAAELTRQLLAFGRQQRIHDQPLDVHEMLDDTLRLLRRLMPENIVIDPIRAHRIPRVLGDRAQLEQVIVNLCVNARDAMPKGGKLVLETELVVINGKFRQTHPWARPGRYVLISVSDTGVGIPREVIDRIYEPFFTTKETGTGLGLASAYGIIKQHGGLLHVYSEPGNGTTFKVYLPVAERNASEVGSKIEEAVQGGRETILLAEDEAAVRRVLCLILGEAGYHVLEAKNGREAVDLFKAHESEIALVLLDAVMPEMSGAQAAADIRARNPQMKLILSSGYSDALANDPGITSGLTFLPKPYEPDTLLRVVRHTLDGKAGS